MENKILNKLEEALKELNIYENKGLDTSSLKIFIKNFKNFLKVTYPINELPEEMTFDDKLAIIKSFLEDRKAFPTINEVIDFANNRLELEFRDQKESRNVTISRIISRIKSRPELKEKLKTAVLSIRNEMVHSSPTSKTKKQIISAEIFSRWADIIKNI